MRWIALLMMPLLSWGMPANAQGVPACAVGLPVVLALDSSAGVITDENPAQGSYRVHLDGTSTEYWVPSFSLRYSCIGPRSGATAVSFFLGPWDDKFIPGAPDLEIGSDGTYKWLTTATPPAYIAGTWYEAGASQLESGTVGPGLILTSGVDGKDWIVESQGDVDDGDREIIVLSDMRGSSQTFVRFTP